MKKLMVLAAVAAAGLSVLADAQLYELQLTMKTTISKSGKVSFVSCDCGGDSLGDMYRKQTTNVKIKGVIWGCDCETIAKPSISTNGSFLAEKPYGYIFWNEKTRKPMNLKFKWEFLNRIDKAAKKTEGTWCDQVAGTEEQTASAPGWSLCRCSDSDARTAATGTWALKYNATASKKLMKASKVTEAYAFPPPPTSKA